MTFPFLSVNSNWMAFVGSILDAVTGVDIQLTATDVTKAEICCKKSRRPRFLTPPMPQS